MKITDVVKKKAAESRNLLEIFDEPSPQDIIECTIDPTAYEEIAEPEEPKLKITKEHISFFFS